MAVPRSWAGPVSFVMLLALAACGSDGDSGEAAGDPTRACEEYRSFLADFSESSFADQRADVGRIYVQARDDGANDVAKAAKELDEALTAGDRLMRDPDRDYVELAEVDKRLAAGVDRLSEACGL